MSPQSVSLLAQGIDLPGEQRDLGPLVGDDRLILLPLLLGGGLEVLDGLLVGGDLGQQPGVPDSGVLGAGLGGRQLGFALVEACDDLLNPLQRGLPLLAVLDGARKARVVIAGP